MKAERRHELKTNSLARNLENAPAFFQQYGSRILLGVILCLLAYILVQRHIQDKAAKAQNAAKALGGALYSLNELRTIPTRVSPEQLVMLRKEYARDTENSLADALANSEDPKIRAQAYVVRGDLNWELANFPVLPGATTRPDQLGLDKTREEYLTAAADACGEVLKPPLDQDHQSVTAARFTLAKIAENRGDWGKARDGYQQLIGDPALGKEFKEWARISREQLKTLEKPIYLGNGLAEAPPNGPPKPVEFGPQAPSIPSTLPAATEPTTRPSTAP